MGIYRNIRGFNRDSMEIDWGFMEDFVGMFPSDNIIGL